MKTKIYVFDDLECEILEIHRLDTYEYIGFINAVNHVWEEL